MWLIIHPALQYYPPIVLKIMSETMAKENLAIEYVWEGDLLCLRNDLNGPTRGLDITTETILIAFHSSGDDRECRGFDFYDAAKLLLPFLRQERLQGELCEGELSVSYSAERDSLKIASNRVEPVSSNLIANGLTAHNTEKGWAMGFTLNRAAELLLPHLQTWRPWTEEEERQIQKVMVEHDADLLKRMAPGT